MYALEVEVGRLEHPLPAYTQAHYDIFMLYNVVTQCLDCSEAPAVHES